MRQVREALGPNAVILSTQPGEYGVGVRLTAALEENPIEDFDLDDNDAGLAGLDAIDDIAEALSYHRFPPGLLDRLVGTTVDLAPSGPVMSLAGALDSEFAFAPLPAANPPRPIMLIGPHGAGKSATTAKLCAHARLKGGMPRLITMDIEKSGGLAQATAFAGALGLKLEQAGDNEALAAQMNNGAGSQLTIIDTAGANPFDNADLSRVSSAAEAAGAGLVLVLPAGGDAMESAEIAIAFAEIGTDRVVGTRLDIARRLGGILSATQAGNLALMAVSTSPAIGDALLPVNPVSLARLLLPGQTAASENILLRETG